MSNIVFKEIAPDAPDEFVPDTTVRQEMGGITSQTTYRWDNDPTMAERGWPPRIHFNGRNYRSRKLLEEFKASLAEVGLTVVRKIKPTGARPKKAEMVQAEVDRVKQEPRQVAQQPLGADPQLHQSKTPEEV
jgi:hypothetical protein